MGKKVFSRIGRVLSLAQHTRVVLVAGQGSIRSNGVYEAITDSLEKHDIFWTEYWGITPNPDCNHVLGVRQLAKDFNADALLAVGGGSVIDATKLAAASLLADAGIWEIVERQKDILEALPCYAVCTCPGAGTEASCSAIVSNPAALEKRSVKGPGLWPQAAFVDPRSQYGLPWLQTLAGGMDTFAHCLEHFISGAMDPQPCEVSLSLCASLMRSVLEALRTLQKDPEAYTARASLAWASILALNGTAGAGLGGGSWVLHLASHALGAHFSRIPHGLAVAALLPGWLNFLSIQSPHAFALLEKYLQGALQPAGSLLSFNELNDFFSCPKGHDFGVSAADVVSIAATAYADAQAHPGSERFFPLSEKIFLDLLSGAI